MPVELESPGPSSLNKKGWVEPEIEGEPTSNTTPQEEEKTTLDISEEVEAAMQDLWQQGVSVP